MNEEVGSFEKRALRGQLLNRVSSVPQNTGVSVDHGDRALARCSVGEARIVGHHPEIFRVSFYLPEVERPDRSVFDRKLIGLSSPVVRDGK